MLFGVQDLPNSSGSLAIFAAIRRASSRRRSDCRSKKKGTWLAQTGPLSNAVRHLALSYDRRRRGRSLSLAHVLRTASDAQESEHRVTAPITAATCNFARSRLVITANLPAPRASRRASDARQRVNSFGGLAILAAIRRAR